MGQLGRAESGSDARESAPRVALVVGGGVAHGLAHIGAMDVFEPEDTRLSSSVGSSIRGSDCRAIKPRCRDFGLVSALPG